MDINSFYMEIALLCQNCLENCLWQNLLEAFNILIYTAKAGSKQNAVFHKPDYGTHCFQNMLGNR